MKLVSFFAAFLQVVHYGPHFRSLWLKNYQAYCACCWMQLGPQLSHIDDSVDDVAQYSSDFDTMTFL